MKEEYREPFKTILSSMPFTDFYQACALPTSSRVEKLYINLSNTGHTGSVITLQIMYLAMLYRVWKRIHTKKQETLYTWCEFVIHHFNASIDIINEMRDELGVRPKPLHICVDESIGVLQKSLGTEATSILELLQVTFLPYSNISFTKGKIAPLDKIKITEGGDILFIYFAIDTLEGKMINIENDLARDITQSGSFITMQVAHNIGTDEVAALASEIANRIDAQENT